MAASPKNWKNHGFDDIGKSSIKESYATPTLFIKDQNATKMRKICQTAKNLDESHVEL